MTRPAISIVIPCYNEAGNIPLILGRLREAIAGRDDVEVVLVDNGSKDESAKIFAEELTKPKHHFATLCKVPVNKGYGYGIMSGLREAKGDVLAWTHADMQTDPADVLLGFEKYRAGVREAGVDNVFLRGRRKARNPLDAFFTFGMTVVSSAALGMWLADVNAQPKMFGRKFFETLRHPPDDFSLDLYVLFTAKLRGMRILEQPVHFGKRKHGEAKGGGTLKGKWKLIKRTWKYIFELRRQVALRRNAD